MVRKTFPIHYLYLAYVCYLSYYLMIWNYFTNFPEKTAYPFILVLFLSGIIHFYLFRILNEKGRIFYLFLIVPLSILAMIYMKISWAVGIIGLALANKGLWTIVSEGKGYHRERLMVKSLGLVLLVTVLGRINPAFEDSSPYFVLLFQFFLFFVGHFLSNWLEMMTERKGKMLVQFASFMAVIFLLSAVLSLVIPAFRTYFGSFLSFLFRPVVWLFAPIIEGLSRLLKGRVGTEGDGDGQREIQEVVREETFPQNIAEGQDFILQILMVASIFLAFFLLFRFLKTKVKIDGKGRNEETIYEEERTDIRDKKREKRTFFPFFPSKNPVRKAMFQFEQKAERYDRGRKKGETVREWFRRLGVEEEKILSLYEIVRYGDGNLSETEERTFQLFLQKNLEDWKEEGKKENQ